MGDLRQNFSRSEFACRHCGRIEVSDELADGLQDLRTMAGAPVIIDSGYRCPAHNRAEGGTLRSWHLTGDAVDCRIRGLTLRGAYSLALRIPAFDRGGIGLYPDALYPFIHLDARPGRARWAQVRGVYVDILAGLDYMTESGG